MIDVGEIEQVDPKKLGIHEEHHFTPWLMQNITLSFTDDGPTIFSSRLCCASREEYDRFGR